MNKRIEKLVLCILLFSVVSSFIGSGDYGKGQTENAAVVNLEKRETDVSSQLSYKSSMELLYADQFAVDYYNDGYLLLTVVDGGRYLVVPEGRETPDKLMNDIVVLERPLENIYLVATAAMDMFRELGTMDFIRFSGQKADGWSMKEARDEMNNGNILYAGKYSMPDYELILSEGCSLAIENNMISHSPEVVEKLESLGIPVFVDFSSYEEHPLGRVEWIKLYGALLDKEEVALGAFNSQVKIMELLIKGERSGKTVAFFFITTNGMVNVRNISDYVPKMIELAGGKYVFDDLGKGGDYRSSITMQMEEFYNTAKEADYLIYNSTIDGEIISIEELIQKDEILKDFKAIQEGNVWCTTRDMYQQSMSIGVMIEDIYTMLSGNAEKQKDMNYIYQLR